jgi:hypothetical protein
MTLLAKTVAGGNAKTCHKELSTKAVAIVVLKVVNAVDIAYPIIEEGDRA